MALIVVSPSPSAAKRLMPSASAACSAVSPLASSIPIPVSSVIFFSQPVARVEGYSLFPSLPVVPNIMRRPRQFPITTAVYALRRSIRAYNCSYCQAQHLSVSHGWENGNASRTCQVGDGLSETKTAPKPGFAQTSDLNQLFAAAHATYNFNRALGEMEARG